MSRHSIQFFIAILAWFYAFNIPVANSAGTYQTVAPIAGFSSRPSGLVGGIIADAANSEEATMDDGHATTQAVNAPAHYSGSWYNPDRDGEGFEFQVLDNGDFLIIFYTYPGSTDDTQAEQSFILGVGTIEGSVATVEGAYRTRGPVFGAGYDKNDLELVGWGRFVVHFLDEDNARVEYDGADGSGTTDVTRLTRLMNPDENGTLSSGMSGMWFDPETNGQGWFVEVLTSTQALVYWFTYDENGNQAWSLGVGQIIGTSIQVPEMAAGRGTRFGNEFVREDITLEPTAALLLEFESCNAGGVSMLDPDGAISLNYAVVKLSNLMGHECTPSSPYPNTRADGRRFIFVATSESDSEYFRDLGISWDTSTQYIFKIDVDRGELAEVDSNFSPSYASSTIYSYTVDDRYFVREQYGTQHSLEEYDPLTLAYQSRISVYRELDKRCSAVTSKSYFYRVSVDQDPFFGDTGGEFMRLDLDGNSGSGNGVELTDVHCYFNLQSNNDILYDAIYAHEYDGSTAAFGLYTRDPVSGVATTMNEFTQSNGDQFDKWGYSFHFDGNAVYIIRAWSAGGFQILRYVHGVDPVPLSIYESGSDLPEDFHPHYRDVDEGYVVVANGSGIIILLDMINGTIETLDLDTSIYDMQFLHVKD